jgi:hypothetical protein
MGAFEPLVLNLKGLPRIAMITVWPRLSDGGAEVRIALASNTRAALGKWAAHMGVDVVDKDPSELYPGHWQHRLEAVYEADGVRTMVWVALPCVAPAAPEPSAEAGAAE